MTIIFLIYHCWFQLITIVIPKRAILDFQNNPYFHETYDKLMPQSAAIFEKKQSSSSKVPFPCKKQATGAILAVELWDTSWKS